MRVNISGRGLIPILGTVAPVYNIEISERQIRRLLNFSMFRVFSTNTGRLITKGNVDDIFSAESHVVDNNTAMKNVDIPVIKDVELQQPCPEISTQNIINEIVETSTDDVNTEEVPVIEDEIPAEDESSSDETLQTEECVESTSEEISESTEVDNESINRRNKKKKRH